MFKRLLAFIKSRPTEVWLGLWTAIVALIYGAEAPTWVTGVSAVIGWIVTFIATKTESLGPQLMEPQPVEPQLPVEPTE